MSKKSNLTKLLFAVNEERSIGDKHFRVILDGIESLNDFKSTIEWFANHIDCCGKQLHKYVQYHHGNKYYYHKTDLDAMANACYTMCDYVGYELYSPNGAWFVRSIK